MNLPDKNTLIAIKNTIEGNPEMDRNDILKLIENLLLLIESKKH